MYNLPVMSRSYILLGCSTLPLLVLYQQHRRLARLYPTKSVPPHLDVGRRDDKPAVGMEPNSGETWRPYQASDAWYVDLPRTAFKRSAGEKNAVDMVEVEPVVAFARAFWGSWPLVLEKKIMQTLIGLGIGPFACRPGSYVCPSMEENEFEPGTGLVGNLFIIEAHDMHPNVPSKTGPSDGPSDEISGPIVISWWLKPSTSSPPPGLLGGYHSFSSRSLPPSPFQPDHIRCTFSSHICIDLSADGKAGIDDSRPGSTQDLQGLTMGQKVSMVFHVLYSRILVDLAVRRMGVSVPWW